MKKNQFIFLAIFTLFTFQFAVAEDWSNSSWEGFWGEFSPLEEPTYGNTFLAITKLSGDEYLVIASSTRDIKNLSFYAVGKINSGGDMVIKTYSGVVWVLARITSNIEKIIVLDETREYDVALCRRLNQNESFPAQMRSTE